mgnify:CR=1 FL=1
MIMIKNVWYEVINTSVKVSTTYKYLYGQCETDVCNIGRF